MNLGNIVAALIAGMLSTLSPCVLPLLPLVLGAAESATRGGAVWLAVGVATAFTAAGLFVATVGFAIGLDSGVFQTVSAVLLGLIGALLLSKSLQNRLALATRGIGGMADRLIRSLRLSGSEGQFAVGALLGLVWSPCAGPTLGAASLLAASGKDLLSVAAVMFAFGIGTTLPLLAVAALSRHAASRWRGPMLATGLVGKYLMGAAALAVAVLILTGTERTLETALVDASPLWLTGLTTSF